MVKKPQAKVGGEAGDGIGQGPVLGGRSRIPAGVVMDQDQAAGVAAQRQFEDFSDRKSVV